MGEREHPHSGEGSSSLNYLPLVSSLSSKSKALENPAVWRVRALGRRPLDHSWNRGSWDKVALGTWEAAVAQGEARVPSAQDARGCPSLTTSIWAPSSGAAPYASFPCGIQEEKQNLSPGEGVI